ncbi:mitochondrial transcription termination factor [Dunaliella salina]|uniref:Mitochondrial transcription termination factor n=1 Tax=Dunaliella salina TaxID=3046 RepID=A0ABQ7HA20_DUNSA|nr:mitochondrial transcription termination factor [Dunaliella salina]|eukprot:KAF5843685.1 mitochondrial transcription termination factor [Dunaliella salina]
MLNLRTQQHAAVQHRGHSAAGQRSVLAPALLPRVSTSRPGHAASRPHTSLKAVEQSEGTRTAIIKNTEGDLPFPWSEKDPYALPVSIDRVQRLLLGLGWEKPWVDQIVDRIMKNMLRTTEERAQQVIDMLRTTGLRQDEICNMASISVVLLGLNPETRIKPVLEYLKKRGVPEDGIADLVLQHPRIFEYKVDETTTYLTKGRARIQVDVLPIGPDGAKVAAVNYFRDIATFLEAPVSPVPPAPSS